MRFWDRLYSGSTFRYGTRPNDFVVECVEHLVDSGTLSPGARAVDLGAGEGRNAVFLASVGFETTAIDASSQGIAKTRSLATRNHVAITTEVADIMDWTASSKFDLVVTTFLHIREPEPEELLRRLLAHLSPGGYFVGEFFHPDQRRQGYQSGGPPDPEMMLTPERAEQALSDTELLVNRSLERHLREGKGHRGRACVTQLLARRRE